MQILIKEHARKQIGELCKPLGKNALVISGKTTIKVAGNKVCDILADCKTEQIISESILKNDADRISINNNDFVVGVGGGRVIDIAKYVAFRYNKPFVSVPTVLSHDGISSSRVTIDGDAGRISYEAVAPVNIICDLSIISNAPYRINASGCADVISNITAVEDWKMNTEDFNEESAELSLSAANKVLKSIDSIKENNFIGMKKLAEALIESGTAMSMAGSSRPASGGEHLFSHAIDKLCPGSCFHGETCGVGSIMTAYLHGLDWMKIRDSLKELGCPVNASDLGIPEDIIIKALVLGKNIRNDRYTILDKKQLNMQKAEELARATNVI